MILEPPKALQMGISMVKVITEGYNNQLSSYQDKCEYQQTLKVLQ